MSKEPHDIFTPAVLSHWIFWFARLRPDHGGQEGVPRILDRMEAPDHMSLNIRNFLRWTHTATLALRPQKARS